MENFCGRYAGRFRYVFKPHLESLNTGVREAQGDLLVFTDDMTTEPRLAAITRDELPFTHLFVSRNDLRDQVDAQRPKHPMTAPYDAANGDAARLSQECWDGGSYKIRKGECTGRYASGGRQGRSSEPSVVSFQTTANNCDRALAQTVIKETKLHTR